jgi:hypothetical protein
VDARPSDAVNLALVSGAPIRLNTELFSVPPAAGSAEAASLLPLATADIAAAAQQRMREQRAKWTGRGPQAAGDAPA